MMGRRFNKLYFSVCPKHFTSKFPNDQPQLMPHSLDILYKNSPKAWKQLTQVVQHKVRFNVRKNLGKEQIYYCSQSVWRHYKHSTGLTGCEKFNHKCRLLYAALADAVTSSSKAIRDCLSPNVQHHCEPFDWIHHLNVIDPSSVCVAELALLYPVQSTRRHFSKWKPIKFNCMFHHKIAFTSIDSWS